MMTTTPRSGRAAVLTDYGGELELRELPVPEPEPGALLVRIDRATICGSDVHAWAGGLKDVAAIELPIMLGHEIVGSVERFGEGAAVDSLGVPLRRGDRVVWTHESCGGCRSCTLLDEPTLCERRRVGMLMNCDKPPYFTGGFGEFGYVWPRAGRVRVPDEIPSHWAAAASCAGRTAADAVTRAGEIDFRHTVVVQGAGPLALYAVAMVRTREPAKLIVVGAPEERLQLARAYGADVTISVADYPDPAARLDRLLEETDGRGADIVFDCAGAPGVFGEGVRMAARGARYVVVGTLTAGTQEVEARRIVDHQLQIVGSYGGMASAYWRAMEFMRRYRDRFEWDRMFGNEYGLGEISTALTRLRDLEELKPIIDPSKL